MLYLGTDHRGFELKEQIKKFLQEQGIVFEDLGNQQLEPEDDYTDFGLAVAKKVAENPEENRGILLCGSGIGMSIIANRIKGVRAGLSLSPWMAEHGRQNEDINVLVLASNISDLKVSQDIIQTFLNTTFLSEEKYIRRKKELDNF
ncbi:MAG TPA: RpiB/LacA/LacB family sugar-phosphate isomerase [Candidatus Paceibacterota bacterium]|mgnify:CR=1 FL=1|nr:RpiB/LacA/LacB family sugar-phosphate isomerase [Candidatus Paceibacterota bacterium]HPT40620.1 RpiB/LacA/LacB family sugar-phosphate isomerase [Candidatus Paceibacterota bacterium]